MAEYPVGPCCATLGRQGLLCLDQHNAYLQRTTNGRVRRLVKTINRSTNTSLPPLPGYCNPASGYRRPWGEDTLQLGTNPNQPIGYSRFRHNFNSCHPVKEQVKRCDEYRFPKAMRVDVGALHGANVCTGRHVYRSPTAQVFPLNNQNRKYTDGHHVLGKATRDALAACAQKLYCTSRYDDVYRDTSKSMCAKLERDAEYQRDSIPYNVAPTCCRVLNHPDPCHWCWTGGLNDHDHVNVPTNGKPCSHSNDDGVPCQLCQLTTCAHKHHCAQPPSFLLNNKHRMPPISVGIEKEQKHFKFENHPEASPNVYLYEGKSKSKIQNATVSDNAVENPVVPSTATLKTAPLHHPIEGIGPWPYDHRLEETEEQMLLPNVYQFKFPSALHCLHTQNEHTFNFLGRHDPYNYYLTPLPDWTTPWASLCRFEHNRYEQPPQSLFEPNGESEVIPNQPTYIPLMPEDDTVVSSRPNRWTYRDENNLRSPCIPDVIGSWQKSAAQKRYHQAHSEPIPDLRDNLKYSKRVSFYGYNSSVYR